MEILSNMLAKLKQNYSDLLYVTLLFLVGANLYFVFM